MNFNYNNLPPFKWFVLQNFPFIEADFDAITNYQLYCKIVEYVNKISNDVNSIGTQTENLTNAFTELQNYVNNYFDNLDVQDEIDNKLDEMAENGELTEIIAQYLQLAGVLAFNTLNDMKDAENLINGSITKTLGTVSYNDGYGHFYKIRTLLNTDVIDNDNIVALSNYPTLIAEKIPDSYINTINEEIEEMSGDITTINNTLQTLTGKNFVSIGDSWSTTDEPNVNHYADWLDNLLASLNYTSDHIFRYANGGCGWVTAGDNGNLVTQLTQAVADMTTDEKNNTDRVLMFAGVNDVSNSVSLADIQTNINTCVSMAKTNFPNATIYLCPMNVPRTFL